MTKGQKIPPLTEELRDDLINFRKVFVKEAAKISRDELTKTAKDAILAFYHDYTPSSYQRHYYNFLNNSFKPLYKNNHNVSYSGGIWLTPEDLDQIYEGDAMTDVADSVYGGYHGNVKALGVEVDIPEMSPSPMEIILNKYDEMVSDFCSNGERWWRAFNVAASFPYKRLSFK